jgi:hypothetical protein
MIERTHCCLIFGFEESFWRISTVNLLLYSGMYFDDILCRDLRWYTAEIKYAAITANEIFL